MEDSPCESKQTTRNDQCHTISARRPQSYCFSTKIDLMSPNYGMDATQESHWVCLRMVSIAFLSTYSVADVGVALSRGVRGAHRTAVTWPPRTRADTPSSGAWSSGCRRGARSPRCGRGPPRAVGLREDCAEGAAHTARNDTLST